jgi:hypothetical protein
VGMGRKGINWRGIAEFEILPPLWRECIKLKI